MPKSIILNGTFMFVVYTLIYLFYIGWHTKIYSYTCDSRIGYPNGVWLFAFKIITYSN